MRPPLTPKKTAVLWSFLTLSFLFATKVTTKSVGTFFSVSTAIAAPGSIPTPTPKAGSNNLKNAGIKIQDPFDKLFNKDLDAVPAGFESSLTLVEMVNFRNCFHGVSGFMCDTTIGGTAGSVFPLFAPGCSDTGVCDGPRVKVEGCYSQNFRRGPDAVGEIGADDRCENSAYPYRIRIMGKGGCTDGATTCTRGAFIEVRITMFDDQDPDNSTEWLKVGMNTFRISALMSGDPLRVSCGMLAEDGYEWNKATGTCERPKKNLCLMLGLQHLPDPANPSAPGSCISQSIDCKLAFPGQNICTKGGDHCAGIRYPASSAGGVPCLCTGTVSTAKADEKRDKAGRPCFDDSNKQGGTDPKSFSVLVYELPAAGGYKPTAPNDVVKRFIGDKPSPWSQPPPH